MSDVREDSEHQIAADILATFEQMTPQEDIRRLVRLNGVRKQQIEGLEAELAAYRRELDQTPVDEAWLRSVGFVKDEHPSKWTIYRDERLPVGLWKVDDGWKAMLIHSDNAASCLVRQQNTRGQLRTLCRALGVELKE